MSKTTKKELREIQQNKDFHSFKYVGYNNPNKNAENLRIDSRDSSVEKVLAYILENKVSGIFFDRFSKNEKKEYDILKGNIEGKKSPVNYGEETISDCKSNDCRKKYGPNGCGWNSNKSLEMQKNPEFKYFWWHDSKRKKEYEITENFSGIDVIFLPDQYLFQKGVTSNGSVILDFGLQFTEYGGLYFHKDMLSNIEKKLQEYGFVKK